MLRPTFTLAAVVLVIPAVASAATSTSKKIASPSKELRCHALKIGGPGIECKGKFLPDFQEKLDLDPYIQVYPRGKTIYGERRDYTGYSAKTTTLKYGDTWKRSGITCKLTRTSFTCKNLDKHGFKLTRHKAQRF
jgi:hypothetical protein